MEFNLSQLDPRWALVRLGPSNASMEDYGCTTTALSMALAKLRGYFCNPGQAARHWTYNSKGEILWYQTKFKGAKFAERVYSFDLAKLKNYANPAHTAAVLEVNWGAHWVYVKSVASNGDISIVDPLGGLVYDKLPKKYTPTGFACLERVKIEPPDWMLAALKKAESKGLTLNDPLEIVDIEKVQEVLYEMGITEKPKAAPTLGWLLVAMDRIKELY